MRLPSLLTALVLVAAPAFAGIQLVEMKNGKLYEVQVTAWDQCGMVPWVLAQGGSSLRMALSTETRYLLNRCNLTRAASMGLDRFCQDGQPSPFPRPSPREDLESTADPAFLDTGIEQTEPALQAFRLDG